MPRFSLNQLLNLTPFARSPARQEALLYVAPEFTPEVVEAVQRISTCMKLRASEGSRQQWQADQEAVSLVEYRALEPLFARRPKPSKVLEIGPGMGRSVVVLGKKGVWEEGAAIHLYDTDGAETKYKQKYYDAPPKWPDVSTFCGNLELLERVLALNGVRNATIFDAAQTDLKTLPGPYDLIYGFYSIGFHWSLDHYLDEIEPLMDERSVLICTLNKHFKPFPRMEGYSTRILEAAGTKKGARPLSFLALSKTELPAVGLSVAEAYPA